MNYYDRAGRPITLREWGELHRDPDYRIVEQTEVGVAWVSTVWLGLDLEWGRGEPVIFETMTFVKPIDDWLGRERLAVLEDLDRCERYGTEADAKLGHQRHVTTAREWWAAIQADIESGVMHD